mgnify:CR=1 FL=1
MWKGSFFEDSIRFDQKQDDLQYNVIFDSTPKFKGERMSGLESRQASSVLLLGHQNFTIHSNLTRTTATVFGPLRHRGRRSRRRRARRDRRRARRAQRRLRARRRRPHEGRRGRRAGACGIWW